MIQPTAYRPHRKTFKKISQFATGCLLTSFISSAPVFASVFAQEPSLNAADLGENSISLVANDLNRPVTEESSVDEGESIRSAAFRSLVSATRAIGSNSLADDNIYKLIDIAGLYKEYGDVENAKLLLDSATLLAQSSADSEPYQKVLSNLAIAYANIGKFGVASELLTESFGQASYQAELIRLAEGYGAIAKAAGDNPQDAMVVQQGLQAITQYALELEAQYEDPIFTNEGRIEPVQGRPLFWLQTSHHQEETLTAVALAYAQLENKDIVNEGLAQLTQIGTQEITRTVGGFNTVVPDSPQTVGTSVLLQRYIKDNAALLMTVARIYQQRGNAQAAIDILDQVVPIIQSQQTTITEYGAVVPFTDILELLPEAALLYNQVGDVAAAEQALAQAMLLTENRPDDRILPHKWERRLAIAIGYGDIGNDEKAQALLAPMVEVTQDFEAAYFDTFYKKMQALEALANAYQQIGDVQGQQVAVQQAFVIFGQEDRPHENYFRQVSRFYRKVTNDNAADRNLALLERYARAEQNSDSLEENLAELSRSAAERGNTEQAQRFAAEAIEQLSRPEVDSRQAILNSTLKLVEAYSHFEDSQAAQAGLEAIEQLSAQIERPFYKYEIHSQLAFAYLQLM